MAGENGESESAVQAAAEAAAQTQAALDAANAETARAVETAAAQVAAAEQTAAQIAQAAVETDLGQRIVELDNRVTQWQTTMADEQNRQATEIQQTQTTLATALTGITEVLARLAPPPSSSIPQPLTGQPPVLDPPIMPEAVIAPAAGSEGADRPAQNPTDEPRKRTKTRL